MKWFAFYFRNGNDGFYHRLLGSDCYSQIDGRLTRFNAQDRARLTGEKRLNKPDGFILIPARSFRQALNIVKDAYRSYEFSVENRNLIYHFD